MLFCRLEKNTERNVNIAAKREIVWEGGGDFSEGVDRLLAGIVGILDPLIEMQSFAIVNRDVLKHHHFTQLPYNKRIKLT